MQIARFLDPLEIQLRYILQNCQESFRRRCPKFLRKFCIFRKRMLLSACLLRTCKASQDLLLLLFFLFPNARYNDLRESMEHLISWKVFLRILNQLKGMKSNPDLVKMQYLEFL